MLAGLGATVIETYWTINGLVADIPLKALPELLASDEVLYINSADNLSAPPYDVRDGRARINSDWYYNQGTPINDGGMIALIDTGVRESHVQISQGSYSRVRSQYNCTVSTCLVQNPSFDDPCNHGTSSAAIMSANTTNNAYRGVTGIGIDAFIMYPTSNCGGQSSFAVRSFQKARELGHKIVVAEMQFDSPINSDISLAADSAFNSGIVVIAANGNTRRGGSATYPKVAAPANAHKALGVGSYFLPNTQDSGQSLGPTSDNRIKSDIQAPTCTVTARSDTNTSTGSFCGTSGATPYAAGAAALVRTYFEHNFGLRDPGIVYAYLISSGDDPYQFGNTRGAGRLRLPGTSTFNSVGKVSISQGQTINIPLLLTSSSGYDYAKASLWWPESTSVHSDIDLFLIDPGGTVRGTSASIPSVFEFTQVNNPVVGQWTLRISGKDVNVASQTVYYSKGGKFR